MQTAGGGEQQQTRGKVVGDHRRVGAIDGQI